MTRSRDTTAAVLAAVQSALEERLKQPIRFESASVDVWSPAHAYAQVTPVKPDGGEIDYNAFAEFRPDIQAGAFDRGTEALLQRTSDGWRVLELRIGATDTKLEAWRDQYGGSSEPRSLESQVASDVASYLNALRSRDAAAADKLFDPPFDLQRELENAFGQGVAPRPIESSDVTVNVHYGPHPPPFDATATVPVQSGMRTRTVRVRVMGAAAYETLIESATRVR